MKSLIYAIFDALARAITSSTNPILDFFSILSAIATTVIALLVYTQNKRFNEENKRLQTSIQEREEVIARFDKIYSIYQKISEVLAFFSNNEVFFHLEIGSKPDVERHVLRIEQFNEELFSIQDLTKLLFQKTDPPIIEVIDIICNRFRKLFTSYMEYYTYKMQKNTRAAYSETQAKYSDIPKSETPDLKMLLLNKAAFQKYLASCSSPDITKMEKALTKLRSDITGKKPKYNLDEIFGKYLGLSTINEN